MMNLLRKRDTKAGFTLIELLVVIAIIGILASIVLASLNTARVKSRDARRIADIKQIQLALELFADANSGEYPDTVAAMTTGTVFIPSEPKDPATQASYPYDNYTDGTRAACVIATGTCLYYHIGALLEEVVNNALKGDRDLDGVAGAGPDGLSVAAACAADGTATAVTDRCYDLTP